MATNLVTNTIYSDNHPDMEMAIDLLKTLIQNDCAIHDAANIAIDLTNEQYSFQIRIIAFEMLTILLKKGHKIDGIISIAKKYLKEKPYDYSTNWQEESFNLLELIVDKNQNISEVRSAIEEIEESRTNQSSEYFQNRLNSIKRISKVSESSELMAQEKLKEDKNFYSEYSQKYKKLKEQIDIKLKEQKKLSEKKPLEAKNPSSSAN